MSEVDIARSDPGGLTSQVSSISGAGGCAVARIGAPRDRLSGRAVESIAALNSIAGSSFGRPEVAGDVPARPPTDEPVPKSAVLPLFCALRSPAGTSKGLARTWG
jgi:hypothetical protein